MHIWRMLQRQISNPPTVIKNAEEQNIIQEMIQKVPTQKHHMTARNQEQLKERPSHKLRKNSNSFSFF